MIIAPFEVYNWYSKVVRVKRVVTMIIVVLIFVVPFWTNYSTANEMKKVPEDALLNFTELTRKYGHTTEEIDITTEDGYILQLLHIPGNRSLPIFIMHGLGDSSDTYVLRGPKSLVITLADLGHDIWLGNNRGNKYSRRHMYLNPDKDSIFWNFSFHEIGFYDLPAMMDYILQNTNTDKINVIAHSQGTTAFFALLSTKPEYNEKINLLAALGPVAFLGNLSPPISTVALTGPIINSFLLSIGVEEIAANESAAKDLQTVLCSKGLIGGNVCRFGIIFTLFGFDPERLEAEFAPIALAHFPAGLSRRSLIHYDQLFFSNRFAWFDYGPARNLAVYNKLFPPNYELKKVTAKVALFVGKNDPFSKIKDVEHLKDVLPNVMSYTVMKAELWTHVDFAWANDMDKSLFPLILELFG